MLLLLLGVCWNFLRASAAQQEELGTIIFEVKELEPGCRSAFVFSTFGKVGDEERSENSTARTRRFLMPLTLHLKSLLLWLLMLEPSTEFGKSENVERSKRENNFGRRRLEAAEIYVRCILPNQEMKSS